MLENPRTFQATDPFGRTWSAEFRWLQNAISIRHADAVDLKYFLSSDEEKREIVIALPHADLRAAATRSARELTDSWCLHLASLHLREMIRTWEDMDKTIVTLSPRDLDRWAGILAQALEETRESVRIPR
jgi:hypothetical protein